MFGSINFSRIVAVISVLVIVAMATVTLGAFAVHHWLKTPLQLSEEKIITVNPGDTLSKVAYQLQKESILSSAKWFILYARLTEKTKIEVGEYLLAPYSHHQQLLDLLQSGEVINYSVTLVEGKTWKDFLSRLHQHPKITNTLSGKTDAEIVAQLGADISHPEGWFFPDTYQFVSGMSDAQLLRQAYVRMKKTLEDEWQNKSENLPYKNAYEALIMASIIEKETGVAYERPEIAGVFVRRLQKGMRLQTDPTIIYGLGDSYTGNIRRKHLRQKTPYNTYVIDGLPPTPIAMPGRAAIHAALHPKPGKSLYFVAKGDGSHYFSATLAEHNRAVNKYQIQKRRKDYQSSPSRTQ